MRFRRSRRVSPVRRREKRARGEKGAYAVLMSMVLVLIIALAAIAVDIAKQVESKQRLLDAMDAAAHAAVMALGPGKSGADAAIEAGASVARANNPGANPRITVWCVIASTGVSRSPEWAQIPGTCEPDSRILPPYSIGKFPETLCDDYNCFIPCSIEFGTCNTVRIEDEQEVPYSFAPAIGHDKGSTGTAVSVACKGSCGRAEPNPLDVVVVADRTPSMDAPDLKAMKDSISAMMGTMDPSMHYLALATIDASSSRVSSSSLLPNSNCTRVGTPRSPGFLNWLIGFTASDMRIGSWMATDFSNTYSVESSGKRELNLRDPVAHAVHCLSTSNNGYNTHLAAPLRSAVQHLWDESATNLANLSRNGDRPGDVRKVVIFETDGAPVEKVSNSGNLTVDTVDSQMGTNEPRSTTTKTACENFQAVAKRAKDKGTLIITIGFGDAATAPVGSCGPGKTTADVLASVASGSANDGCASGPAREHENRDGDNFFCAVNGPELASVFTTAFGQLSKGVKFLKMPR